MGADVDVSVDVGGDTEVLRFDIYVLFLLFFSVFSFAFYLCRGVGMGSWGKQVGSMDEEPQVRGCYNITFICTPTNQETV